MIERISRTAVLIIIVGLILGLTSAVVPFYNAGYKLMVAVLMAGVSPYFVYGVAIPYLRGATLIIPGLLLITAHTWLVIVYRLTLPVDYSDNWIYLGPLLLAVAVLPLTIRAIYVLYTRGFAPQSGTQTQSEQEEPSEVNQ